MDAPRDEPVLGDHEPLALAAEQRVGGHAHVLVEDLGVAAELAEARLGVLHRRDVAQDVDARRVGRDEEHRGALVRARVGVGDRHHDQEVGDRGVAREPLVTVDDPLVALTHRARAQQRRVRAGVRLGHREGRLEVAAEQRLQVALLLLGRSGEREDLAVAGVRRLVAEGVRRERAGAEDLVHQPELHLAEALPAELRIEVRGPQPALLDLLLERRVDAVELRLVELAEDRLDRPDLLAHEVAHPFELLLELRIGREVPCHVGASPLGAGLHRRSAAASYARAGDGQTRHSMLDVLDGRLAVRAARAR